MPNDGLDRGDEQKVEQDPRLVQVYDKKDLSGGTILHRLDENKRCSNAPKYKQLSTDLVTAAVMSDHALCDRCEWPEGAKEVLYDE